MERKTYIIIIIIDIIIIVICFYGLRRFLKIIITIIRMNNHYISKTYRERSTKQ